MRRQVRSEPVGILLSGAAANWVLLGYAVNSSMAGKPYKSPAFDGEISVYETGDIKRNAHGDTKTDRYPTGAAADKNRGLHERQGKVRQAGSP